MTKAEEIYERNVNYEWNGVSMALKHSIIKAINEALMQTDVIYCTCKIPFPKQKCSENGNIAYCAKCCLEYKR